MSETNKQKIPFLVRVSCMTYNHAPYIEDAMNGFTMQQTDFPFVCTIVDDASTDGEPEVIRKYLQEHFDLDDKVIVRNEETDDFVMTFARHKDNHNCYFAVYLLKYNHYSIKKNKFPYYAEFIDQTKYAALCEGDDYWIDRQKIQRQYLFLDNEPKYVAISENGIYLDMINKAESNFSTEPSRDLTIREMIVNRRFPTASVMHRNIDLTEFYNGYKYHFDTMFWCYLATKGYFRYDNVVSSVYRRGPGITEKTNPYDWANIVEQWYNELYRKFSSYISKDDFNKILVNQYVGLANKMIKKGCISIKAFELYKRAMFISPKLVLKYIFNKLLS